MILTHKFNKRIAILNICVGLLPVPIIAKPRKETAIEAEPTHIGFFENAKEKALVTYPSRGVFMIAAYIFSLAPTFDVECCSFVDDSYPMVVWNFEPMATRIRFVESEEAIPSDMFLVHRGVGNLKTFSIDRKAHFLTAELWCTPPLSLEAILLNCW